MRFTATGKGSLPDIDAAERKYLVPILTPFFYKELQAQANVGPVVWDELLTLCRAAAAPLAVALDLPFIQAQIGDSGLKTTNNPNEEAAHQWEYDKVEKGLLNKGMAALEDLLEHLLSETYTIEVNGSSVNWSNGEATESFIRTGKDFTRFATIYQPNYTFLLLKPLMVEVEDHIVRPLISAEFFEALRDVIDLSKEERAVSQLIKKMIAHYTIAKAVGRLPVAITPNGLMGSVQNNSDAFNMEKPATDSPLSLLKSSSEKEAENYKVQLMDRLYAYATLPAFNKFKNSSAYKPRVVNTTQINDSLTGICAFI
jgi:hypothetical protein